MSDGEGKCDTGDGANHGSPSPAVAALQRTRTSLTTIHARLKPFLQLAAGTEAEADERALAQAAIALSIATLRVVGFRLRGQDRGRAPDDPLRQELNRIRAALQEANAKCKVKQKERDESASKPPIPADERATGTVRLDEPHQAAPHQSNGTGSAKRKEAEKESNVQTEKAASTIHKKPRTR